LSVAPQASISAVPCSRCFSEHICNPFDDGIDIACYLGVPESQHAKSIGTQECATDLVLAFSLGVLGPIKFDNQVRFEANEVGEEGTDRELPAESESVELPSAQLRPQLPLGFREVGA
jgi:hypothetical protein